MMSLFISLCRVATNAAVKLIEQGRFCYKGEYKSKIIISRSHYDYHFHCYGCMQRCGYFLYISDVVFDGVILEGTFNSARQPITAHPFSWVDSSNT